MDTNVIHILKRSSLILSIMLLISISAFAQKPVVRSVEPVKGSMDQLVSVNGSNFGTDASKITVFFGATKGTVVSVTDQLIEVKVPAGTTYNNVSVTYSPSITPGFPGLTGYSRDPFFLSFGGDPGIDINNLVGPTHFDATSGSGLYDLCLCDFDGDKKVDIATAHRTSNQIYFFNNTSTPGTIGFGRSTINLGVGSTHVKCGDLNGDMKPDLVVTQDNVGLGDEIYVLQNTSSVGNISFGAPMTLKLTGLKPIVPEIADLDNDGLPEIIFTVQGTNIGTVGVLKNQSTAAAVQMSSVPLIFTLIPLETSTTDGISINDLNGDNLPEIVTSQLQTGTSNIYILANKSTSGTINFDGITKLNIGNTVKEVRLADLDGDNKVDITASQLLGSAVSVFLNQSNGTTFSFGAAKVITTEINPWGFDFGDLDGDGKTDIVVSSVKKANLTILNNTSSPGNVSFNQFLKPTSNVTRQIQVGDLDGDGKPDIAFASIDDATLGNFSKVSVFRNKACMVPKVTPEGPLTICAGVPLQLVATGSKGTTYEWKNLTTNTTVKSSVDAFYDVLVSGQYQVTAIAEGGACSKTSNIVNVTVSGAGVVGTAVIPPAGPICTGGTLQLSVNSLAGATDYKWTGPAGYTGSGLTPAPVPNFSTANTGRYYLEVIAGGCVAQRTSTTVGAVDIDDFKVSASGSEIICQGDPAKTLSVSPTPAGFTYQWYEKTSGLISGETGITYSASASGEYSVKATSVSCGTKETPPLKISLVSVPVVAFTMPAIACKGQDVKFANQSTTDPSVEATYLWNFGDTKSSSEQNATHNYTSTSVFNVKLTVSYKNGSCLVTTPTQPISIQNAPVAAITNPTNKYLVCIGEKLKLEVLGSFTSYKWSTGETASSILVEKEGIYKVEVTTSTCTLNAERIVEETESSVAVSADPVKINEGQSSQLTASGLLNYTWTPPETLSNPSIATPVASPISTTIYTVTGKDKNDCNVKGTLELTVVGEAIVNKLTPSNFFSPNKSGPLESESWLVDKILDYPQCAVAIFDDKGVKVYEAKPYVNDWDGTMKGKRLPDGVYYYVIRCDGEESKPKSGSITLLR